MIRRRSSLLQRRRRSGPENTVICPNQRSLWTSTRTRLRTFSSYPRKAVPAGWIQLSLSIAQVLAVLFFPQGKVSIDSKFPLENFRRLAQAEVETDKKACRREFLKDVKRRIDEVAAKYIRPADGTLPFALMYIPAENVYYESIIRDEDGTDLYAYCLQKRVIPVSPNSLYAYLQTILMGLNSMRVSQRAEVVLLQIESLKLELGKFGDSFETIGKHLRNAGAKYDESSRMLEKVEMRVENLAGGANENQASLFEIQEKALKTGAS